MNIDERLEKLTERHEALTQTVELIASMQRDTQVVVERMLSIERETQLAIERMASIQTDTQTAIGRIVTVIESLAEIVRSHENRINRLEGLA